MAPDLVGTEILGYKIQELLGEGGMASVWRAENVTLGTEVAIKVLDPPLAKDTALVERFVDEARIQVKLSHPNVVKIENFSLESLAMVMELIPGSALDELIGNKVGPIPIERALPMINQILDAVEAAHDMGIIHRDLKPSNVLVTPEGEIKVMDFGIAKVLGGAGRTRTGTSMGTPDYMAPEQIKGAKDVCPTADVYALGVTFYEMLSGRTPFALDPEANSEFEMMEAQVYQQPPDPREFYPSIPEAVVDVLMRSLEKAPADRYQTIAEMREALVAAAGVESVEDAAPTPATAPAPAATKVEEPSGTGTRKTPAPTVVEEPPEAGTAPVEPEPTLSPVPARSRMNPMILVGVGVGFLVIIGLLLVVVFKDKATPTVAATSTSSDDDDDDDDDDEEEEKEVSSSPTLCSVPGVPMVDHTPIPRDRWDLAAEINSRGFKLYKKKRLTEAMEKWKQALRLAPGHTFARYNLACGYALTGDGDKAMCLLEHIKAHLHDPRCKRCARQMNRAKIDSDLDSLRNNSRFKKILR